MTSWSRLLFIALPSMVSATPVWYMLAVSKKLMPASMQRFTNCVAPAWSSGLPKVMVPKQKRETSRSVCFSLMVGMLMMFSIVAIEELAGLLKHCLPERARTALPAEHQCGLTSSLLGSTGC